MSKTLRSVRIAYVPQLESAECGAACLGMVLQHFGSHIPAAELRVACGVTRDGASAAQLVSAAKGFGLDVRAIKVELAELPDLPVPAILHWEFNHFVVLERASARGARIVDPASGRRWVASRELDRAFTGIALALAPGPSFVRKPGRSASLRWYRSVLARSWPAVVLLLIAATLLEIIGSLYPAAQQLLIDHVIGQKRDAWLSPLVAALATAAALQLLLQLFRGRLIASLAYSLDLVLSTAMVDKLLSLPVQFFAQRSAGDLLQRVAAVEQLRQMSTQAATAALDGLLVLSYSALLLMCDVQLALLVFGACALRLVLLAWLSDRVRQLAAAELALRGPETAAVLEGLAVPEMVKAFHAESLLIERYTDRLIQRCRATLKLGTAGAGLARWSASFDVLVTAAVLWLGGHAVIDERMTVGTLVCALTACALLQAAVSSLNELAVNVSCAGTVVSRIDDVMNAGGDTREFSEPAPELRGEIELANVGYRHAESSPWIFRHLNVQIAAGEKIAVVGRSGSGKTTLMRLLIGLVPPSEGEVRIDGRDLRSLNPADVRPQLGVVLQEPFMMADSIRANLSLYRPSAELIELRRAAVAACIAADIEALPDRYDTPLGAAGHAFSRGQLQRLALARALVARPRVLVLDEATSSLDLETEGRLHANLRQLGCTRILIAHRLTTVQDADRIFVLDDGRFVQQGSYAQLASVPGPFQTMVASLA